MGTHRTVRALVVVAALIAATMAAPPGAAQTTSPNRITQVRPITFPVDGPHTYRPDFLAPRGGGTRQHAGTDVFADRLTPLVAAADGTVVRASTLDRGLAGNFVVMADDDGWEYTYAHLNNDSPGTDDGTNPPEWILAEGIEVGTEVSAGELLGYLGDSGNAETTPPHVHFEITRPDGTDINPWPSLRTAQGLEVGDHCVWSRNPPRRPDDDAFDGAWLASATGEVTATGLAEHHGDMSGVELNGPVLALTPTATGQGYWMIAADGGVFSFGDAEFWGSLGSIPLNEPIVSMAATPAGDGYWMVAADGGVFAFGASRFLGSMGGVALNEPVTGMVPTTSGDGYLLVARDGGVFAFGDAPFHGSLPGSGVDDEVRAVGVPGDARGYWLLNDRGGVYPFGDVDWHGSVQSAGLCDPRQGAAIATTTTGEGYWILTTDGRVWPFGDAVDLEVGAAEGSWIALAAAPPGAGDRALLGDSDASG